jgi:hypothetical protein
MVDGKNGLECSRLNIEGVPHFPKSIMGRQIMQELCLVDPIIDHIYMYHYLRFYVPLKNLSLLWRRHHCRWRAAKFRPMLGAQGLWAGRDLYRATPAVTRDLGFSGLIRRTAPFSRLLQHTRGYGGSILTGILTGCTFNRNIYLFQHITINGYDTIKYDRIIKTNSHMVVLYYTIWGGGDLMK